MNKVKLDYEYIYKSTKLTWKDLYHQFSKTQRRACPLLYKTKSIGTIWLISSICNWSNINSLSQTAISIVD